MFTPERKAKLHQKLDSTPEALRRDSLANYFEGYFFVTLNTRGETPILSSVVGHIGGTDAEAPHCEYTELGKKVIESWNRMPTIDPYVKLWGCEAMPEHFHGLLQLLPGNKRHLGSLISGFMSGCSHGYWDTLGINWRKNHPTQGDKDTGSTTEPSTANAYASKVPDRDRDHTHSYRGPALFVHGYNDVVPITESEVQIKIEYIQKQAEKRLIQGDRHRCFYINRHKHSQNWTAERAIGAVRSDPAFAHNQARCEEAVKNLLSRFNTDEKGLCFDYLGDPTIFTKSPILPLVCHRADASRFEEQKQAVLAKAREGAIIVSAFISPKERDIRNQLMVERIPFIEIMDNGFAERYKPVGKAFYACAENRLLQISCWNYLYQRNNEISREMCLVMNELARIICGQKDDWWKSGEAEI